VEAVDLIFKRRSIRKFTDEPVSNAQIDLLLQAAMAAPTAMNLKPWHFVVVTEAEILRRINHTLIFGKMKAPCAVSVCGDLRAGKRVEKFWIQDCSAATENLLLAATGLGLGAVWCGVTPIERYQKQIAEILLLPQGVIPLNVIFIGHPAEEKPPRTQYDPKNISHNAFGNPWQAN
jgi:nitroreductase